VSITFGQLLDFQEMLRTVLEDTADMPVKLPLFGAAVGGERIYLVFCSDLPPASHGIVVTHTHMT
jgi:hypothetical protein